MWDGGSGHWLPINAGRFGIEVTLIINKRSRVTALMINWSYAQGFSMESHVHFIHSQVARVGGVPTTQILRSMILALSFARCIEDNRGFITDDWMDFLDQNLKFVWYNRGFCRIYKWILTRLFIQSHHTLLIMDEVNLSVSRLSIMPSKHCISRLEYWLYG